jgi:hypothetical protein
MEMKTEASASKEIFEMTKSIPSLTDLQLEDKYRSLTEQDPPKTNREWLLEAVIRLIQNKYYLERNMSVPPKINRKFKEFFEHEPPLKKKRKTPPDRKRTDREALNKERTRVLRLISDFCSDLVEDGNITIHPETKYATVKSGKSVVMFVEKKLRKIIVFMGGERNRNENPQLIIKIGTSDEDIKSKVKEFVEKHVDNYLNKRDRRWSKCKYVIGEVIKHFKSILKEHDKVHAHPSGRYTTFKKGRRVLVFITQDRAKGEVAFHPGGERESDPDLTTVIDVNEIKNSVDVKRIVENFIDTHYKKYMQNKEKEKNRQKDNLKKIIKICCCVIPHDSVFQHPNDLFGLIKKEGKPLIMIKRGKNEGDYQLVAWVKKQKNNPYVEVNINDGPESIQQKTTDLIEKHLPSALK